LRPRRKRQSSRAQRALSFFDGARSFFIAFIAKINRFDSVGRAS
jgi:hypothetical protein